jgi:hypothetical protein
LLANWIGLVGGGQTKLATRSPLPLGQISIEQIETEFFATVRSGSILQRMVEAQELANLVAYVASPPLIRDKLRAYSPISIPSTFSKLKALLRKRAARSFDAISQALGDMVGLFSRSLPLRGP